MEYVIIGNGTAAIACIEGIRSIDGDSNITLVSSEKQHCYGRPLISYCLLGKITKDKMDYRPRDFYEKNKVKTLLGVRVEKIEKSEKKLILSNGESVNYDKLLVATGSRPFVPPMDGLDSVKNKFTFMSYDDMEALEKVLSPKKKVLIIGAGLIGLKCLEGILDRVKKVTVIDLADRILPSILDKRAADSVQGMLESKGVEFILNDCAESFKTNKVVLKNSQREIDFDILVVAVGVRANTELVKEIGGEVNRGIVVNSRMQTSVEDIYSAGDCSEGYDKSIDANRVLALLPNAYFQGKCAGVNMAGGETAFIDGTPLNAIGFFGWHILTAGNYDGEVYEHIEGDVYKKLFVKNDKLVGYILINDFLRAGIYTSLVRNGTSLSSLDKELLLKSPQLLAFGKEYRDSKLTMRV